MGCGVFKFKQFTIHQQHCAMKVGTDGTLLGAWCRTFPHDKLSLDIGTGTGLIAIMLAQRSSDANRVYAIECDRQSFLQARENISASPWSERIIPVYGTIQNFAAQPENWHRFDNIVSNPPYFSNSLLPPDSRRSAARHTTDLSYDDLLRCSTELLSAKGRISVIIPESESALMVSSARRYGLEVSRQTKVKTVPDGEVKRRMIEFSFAGAFDSSMTDESSLCIENADGTFSEKYIELTKDFYLKF